MQEIIKDTLRPFGLSRKYRGYPVLICAVRMTITDEDQTSPITKKLYARVAEECDCPTYCVEKNIRTVIMRAWKVNRTYMEELAGYPLGAPPTVSEFIDIVASHIQRNCLSKV